MDFKRKGWLISLSSEYDKDSTPNSAKVAEIADKVSFH